MPTPNARNVHERYHHYLGQLNEGMVPDAAIVHSLVEDLNLYQAELETQNEELVLAQRKLEESRQQYVALFDLAPIGYIRISQEGIIVGINLRACSLLGVERRKILITQTPLVALLAASSHATFFRTLTAACSEKVNLECEVQPLSQTGAILMVNVACQESCNKQPECLLCMTDITLLRKTERALSESSAELVRQNQELARFNRALMGRENRLVELKKEVNALRQRLNEPPLYTIAGES